MCIRDRYNPVNGSVMASIYNPIEKIIVGAEQLIQEMIDDPGEYNLFMNRLQEYHGFDQSFQDKVDEAKN